ncbi:MAG: ferritin [Spirochaetales bacterium]|nr:ferritin [Spirochaetales bacterium]
MSIDKKMEDAINEQINAEMHSAYLYLSMATWFEEKNLGGFAHWMKGQYMEETMHAMKMYNFLTERGGRVLLKPIKEVDTDWADQIAVFEQVAAHEALVTSLINKLVRLSRELDDYASESFFMWFVDEQVEEEATADEILQKLKMIKDDPTGTFQMDTELSARPVSAQTLPTIMNEPGKA